MVEFGAELREVLYSMLWQQIGSWQLKLENSNMY